MKKQIGDFWDFGYWLKFKYSGKDNPKGDFYEDMRRDIRIDRKPFQKYAETNHWYQSYDWIMTRLVELNACFEAIEMFKKLWDEYRRDCPRGVELHENDKISGL